MAKHHPRKDLNFRLSVLNSAEKIGITITAELFNLTRSTIYRWKKSYTESGCSGLTNTSRREQFHPKRISEADRGEIIRLAGTEPNLTLREIIRRLDLKCSINTVSKILQQQSHSGFSVSCQTIPFTVFYLNIEKIVFDGSLLPAFLLQIREQTTGLSVYAFANENSPNAAGIFADYFLYHLKKEISTDAVTFLTCKGRFYYSRSEKETFLERVIQHKYGARITASTEKLKIDNELLNFIITHKTCEINSFCSLFFNQIVSANFGKIRQQSNCLNRLLLLQPLLIDLHSRNIQEIATEDSYWKKINEKMPARQLQQNLFEYLMIRLEERVQTERDLPALEAFGDLFSLLELSCSRNPVLEAKLLFKFSEALDLCSEWKKAEQTVLKILRLVNFKTTGSENNEMKALKFIGYINEKNGNYCKAARYYRTALLKLKNSKTGTLKKIELLEKIGFCYKLSGKFKQSINCYKRIFTLAATENLLESCYLAQKWIADVFFIKGNYGHANKLLFELLTATNGLENPEARAAEIAGELARNYYHLHNYITAEKYSNQQISWLRKTAAGGDYYRAQVVLGMIKHRLGKTEEARFCFQEYTSYQEQVADHSKDKLQKVIIWAEIGSIKKMEKEYPVAIAYLKKSIRLAGLIENRNEVAFASLVLGGIYLDLGKYSQSIKYSRLVLDSVAEENEFRLEFYANYNLALAYFKLHDYANSKKFYELIVKTASQSHNTVVWLNCCKHLALLDYSQGNYSASIVNFKNYLTHCIVNKSPEIAQVYHYLANAMFNIPDSDHSFSEIENYYQQAEKIYLKEPDQSQLCYLLFDRIQFYCRYHHREAARRVKPRVQQLADMLNLTKISKRLAKLKL